MPDPAWDWRPVVVIGVTPATCHIRPHYPGPTERARTVTPPIPVGELHVADQPE